ncbi:MAG: UDP-diphosphatase [Flavobacteriales bacterium]|nr:UDP-diphosphatase [Flavobacteriales bacterium]
MIEEIKYFLLGVIQGLAEFFPISSSGHIVLFSSLLDLAEDNPLLLSVTVHFATTLSTIIIYRKRLKELYYGVVVNQNKNELSFLLKIIISSVPIIIIGFLFRDNIATIFNNYYFVTIMLLLTAVFLIGTSFISAGKNKITYLTALLMGLAQACAILPGISRSGATISMALLLKVKSKDAAEFSFLMALLPILGITFIELITLFYSDLKLSIDNIKSLIIAFLAAFLAGLFACKYMISIVEKNNLKYFGFYCIIVAYIVLYFVFF